MVTVIKINKHNKKLSVKIINKHFFYGDKIVMTANKIC
jgi:hypothetical protein